MNPRAEYLLQMLDKIGGPLVAALAHAQGESDAQSLNPEVSAREDAQTIAQLLARCVQMSIEIGRVMELDMTDQQQADRLRLALMVLAGPLIAGQYKADGRVPGDLEQKKIMTGLEAVLAFSQNFTPSPENAASLAGADKPEGGAELVQAMRHFTPVINAVGMFPFGQPEKKLIQDVSARITARAEEMAKDLLGDPVPADKLLIVRSLAEMYAECHLEEMRLMLSKGQDDQDVQQGLDNVWIRFNMRAAMLEALAQNLAPPDAPAPAAVKSEDGPAPPASAPSAAPPPAGGFDPMAVFAKKEDAGTPEAPPVPPAVETPPAPPAPPAAPQAPASGDSPPPGGFNPMSMFAKKDAEAPPPEAAAPPPAELPPPPPPSPSSPPVETAPPPVSPPAPENPAGENGGDDKAGESGSSGSSGDSGQGAANPMSFFKK